LKVIKRDGRTQEFNIHKIILTLEKVSEEIEEPFTESDINNLSGDILTFIKTIDGDKISVKDIQDIVVEELVKLGFNKASKHYKEYRKYTE
jgi:transcriptional regulator NrdR family protein